MIKIEVLSTETRTFDGTSKRTGNPFSITKQVAWAFFPNSPYPSEMEIMLKDGQRPYDIGEYKLSPSSLGVNGYKSLIIDELQLIAIAKTNSGKAA